MDNPLLLFLLAVIFIIVVLLTFAAIWYRVVEPVIRQFVNFVFQYNKEDRH